MTAKVTSRKLEVMVCGSVVVCVPTMPKALDSVPSTAREGGSVDKAIVEQVGRTESRSSEAPENSGPV